MSEDENPSPCRASPARSLWVEIHQAPAGAALSRQNGRRMAQIAAIAKAIFRFVGFFNACSGCGVRRAAAIIGATGRLFPALPETACNASAALNRNRPLERPVSGLL